MSVRFTSRRSGKPGRPRRGRVAMNRLRRMTEDEIARTSPPELADLPPNFWGAAEIVVPAPKRAISLRLDQDVLEWFRKTGPRYQTRMNAVLRSYMARMQRRNSDGKPNVRHSGK